MTITAINTAPVHEVAGDIVVVGGGMAGLTLARKLAPGRRVIVLERGGPGSVPVDPTCADGEVVGLPYPLGEIRDFRLGGSSSVWAGYIAQLDRRDFAIGLGTELGGWPIEFDELAIYADEAASLLNISSADFAPDLMDLPKTLRRQLSPHGVGPQYWRFSKPIVRMGNDWFQYLSQSPEIAVLTGARALEILLTHAQNEVEAITCMAADGSRFEVRGSLFVLASGGLETPRLMLASQSRSPAGVGNYEGLVGTCFCEHPHLTVPGFELATGSPLNAYATTGVLRDGSPAIVNFALDAGAADLNARAHFFRTPAMAEDAVPRLGIFCEQSPIIASRVSLADGCDSSGVRKLVLDWRIAEQDIEELAAIANSLSEAFSRAGHGRLVRELHPGDIGSELILHSNHQLGTTRMATTAKQGVVDRNARVFGVDNLFVAGGSIFPRVGWANPTFTVMQCTLRLADHIAELV
ncbi:GMC oxidoreductase [Croceicoccus sp. Ery15]|uniref:GMC oxidoreductase n=1 Tax=Croceicoccus sp. Ery15 TaxID=1703338 RepID=UPI001E5BE602|nr:GMC family oxidoreductase [Croceicoccus sp. Ery15]